MSGRVVPITRAQNGIAAAEKMGDLGEAAVAQAYIALVYCMAAWTGSERTCSERKCATQSVAAETRHVVRFPREAVSRKTR
jgi:hypothetical protein